MFNRIHKKSFIFIAQNTITKFFFGIIFAINRQYIIF